MDYQFIDITSYRGVSSTAVHFYAKIGNPNQTQENLITMMSCEPGTGQSFVTAKNLRFFPSEQEALEMWKIDNHILPGNYPESRKQEVIENMMEDGTIRFPSIPAIVKKAREEFPNSIICFSLFGSRKEFVKYIQKLAEKDKKTLDEIFKIIFK